MLTYRSNIPSAPPVSQRMRDAALSGILAPSPYGQSDLYGALAKSNAVDYDRAASAANAEYENKRRQAMNALVVSGLGQMADQQQQRNDLMNKQSSLVYGTVGGLLGGLFD